MDGGNDSCRCPSPAAPQEINQINQTQMMTPRSTSHSLGLLPAERERELMMGMNMPPARAVVEGMAGAMTASATQRP